MTVEERQTRLEQVMTALAEAQVRTEDALADFTRETKANQALTDAKFAQLTETMNALAVRMGELAQAQTKLADAQTKTEQQFQAYLNTRKQ